MNKINEEITAKREATDMPQYSHVHVDLYSHVDLYTSTLQPPHEEVSVNVYSVKQAVDSVASEECSHEDCKHTNTVYTCIYV